MLHEAGKMPKRMKDMIAIRLRILDSAYLVKGPSEYTVTTPTNDQLQILYLLYVVRQPSKVSPHTNAYP